MILPPPQRRAASAPAGYAAPPRSLMLAWFERLLSRLRRARWANVSVANLRILIGFALVPSGLKKVIGEPFTDPANTGPFHEFLHAFYATGFFYPFVGSMQLLTAALLMTQRFATIGAMLLAPILTAIVVFCWSTKVYPTAVVATLMLAGTIGLLLWDLDKWRGVAAADHREARVHIAPLPPVIDLRLWRLCGLAILVFYLAVCAVSGEIYRPKGVEIDEPAFYVLPAIMLMPLVTFAVDQARHRRAARGD
jgi:uncharacterized membrane protein YphA (DoxX/SURF4 family)